MLLVWAQDNIWNDHYVHRPLSIFYGFLRADLNLSSSLPKRDQMVLQVNTLEVNFE